MMSNLAETSAASTSARLVNVPYHSWKLTGLNEPAIPAAYKLPTSYLSNLLVTAASYNLPSLSPLPSRASKAKAVRVRPSISSFTTLTPVPIASSVKYESIVCLPAVIVVPPIL